MTRYMPSLRKCVSVTVPSWASVFCTRVLHVLLLNIPSRISVLYEFVIMWLKFRLGLKDRVPDYHNPG